MERLGAVAVEWLRIGVPGFGGPPSHIALLRRLVVDRRRWIDARARLARSRRSPGLRCPDAWTIVR